MNDEDAPEFRPEAPISTGQAARIYGFGTGPAARRRFVDYVEGKERESGRAIFLRDGKGHRRITDSIVRKRLPELAKANLKAIELRIAKGLRKIDESLGAKIDQHIEEHHVIAELRKRDEDTLHIVEQLSERLLRVSENAAMRPKTTDGYSEGGSGGARTPRSPHRGDEGRA